MDVYELLAWVSDCRHGEGSMPKDDGFLAFFSTDDLAMADMVARELGRVRSLDEQVRMLQAEVSRQASTIITLSERCQREDIRAKALADMGITLACSTSNDTRPSA